MTPRRTATEIVYSKREKVDERLVCTTVERSINVCHKTQVVSSRFSAGECARTARAHLSHFFTDNRPVRTSSTFFFFWQTFHLTNWIQVLAIAFIRWFDFFVHSSMVMDKAIYVINTLQCHNIAIKKNFFNNRFSTNKGTQLRKSIFLSFSLSLSLLLSMDGGRKINIVSAGQSISWNLTQRKKKLYDQILCALTHVPISANMHSICWMSNDMRTTRKVSNKSICWYLYIIQRWKSYKLQKNVEQNEFRCLFNLQLKWKIANKFKMKRMKKKWQQRNYSIWCAHAHFHQNADYVRSLFGARFCFRRCLQNVLNHNAACRRGRSGFSGAEWA